MKQVKLPSIEKEEAAYTKVVSETKSKQTGSEDFYVSLIITNFSSSIVLLLIKVISVIFWGEKT